MASQVLNTPIDVYLTIFGFLPSQSLLAASRVCKMWREIINTPYFWKEQIQILQIEKVENILQTLCPAFSSLKRTAAAIEQIVDHKKHKKTFKQTEIAFNASLMLYRLRLCSFQKVKKDALILKKNCFDAAPLFSLALGMIKEGDIQSACQILTTYLTRSHKTYDIDGQKLLDAIVEYFCKKQDFESAYKWVLRYRDDEGFIENSWYKIFLLVKETKTNEWIEKLLEIVPEDRRSSVERLLSQEIAKL